MFEKTIPQLVAAMESGTLTSEWLTAYYLRRIAVFDRALNAMITVNPAAMDAAREMDRLRAKGVILGPLHGIPLVLKDNFDTFDMPTTCGARAFANLRPTRDAFVVERLRKAGSVLIGKANLTEMALHGMTTSSIIGQTLNPYDLTRTPGGSSGGTGAAVAANFAVAGTGSDTVNSIRSPASANSLVGIRPSRGLTSRRGIAPCAPSLDAVGPIARTVVDAAILLGVMAGRDPEDASNAEPDDGAFVADYTSFLVEGGCRGKRIALVKNNVGDDPAVVGAVEQAVRDFANLGATMVEVDIPELYVPSLLENNDVQKWEQGPSLDRYLASHGDAAPVKSARDYVATGLLHPGVARDMAAKAAEKSPEDNPEYLARLERNRALRVFVEGFMAANNIDAFLYPHQTVLVAQTNDPRGQAGRNGFMASTTGLPAIALPGGFSPPTDTARQGIPIGMELMGKPFDEGELLCLAYDYERATRHRKPPPAIPEKDLTSVVVE